jgi:hypothetical protein
MKNGPIEILVERCFTYFQSVHEQLVALFEILAIEMKLFDCAGARSAVPAVGKENAAYIGKDGGDFGHKAPPAPALLKVKDVGGPLWDSRNPGGRGCTMGLG